MTTSYISSKAISGILWFVNQISKKFTAPYNKLKQWFPILEQHKGLRYATIPLVILFIAAVRWGLKQVISLGTELLASHSEIDIAPKTILMVVMGTLISTKIITQVIKGKQQNAEK